MTQLSDLVGWVLAGFYSLVPNYAVAIILLGLTFMALVVPLTLKSTRSMLAMQKLQPQMKQLQQQFKNDRVALNQALTQLYKEEGVSPFGSCIPTLIPLPLFYVLYRVIEGLGNKFKHCPGTGSCADPEYLNHNTKMYKALVHSAPAHSGAQIHALGINLATSPWTAITKHLGVGEVFGALLLLVIMIGANYYQQVQISNLNPMVRQNQQMNSQMRMMRLFPIIFGLICLRLPAGLILYYAVSALFRVGQQWMMYRYDPKVKALVARDERDIEATEARLEQGERKGAGRQDPDQQRRPTLRASAKAALSSGSSPANLPVSNRPNSGPPNGKQVPAKQVPARQNGGRQPSRYQGSGNSQRGRSRRRRGR